MQMLQAPVYLTRAAKETGVERFKHVIAFYCALQYVDPIQRKPFNPILGETFQCKIGNYNMALEQTSHHPPISHFIMWSDDAPVEEQFTMNGYLEYRAKTAPNSAQARRVGRLQIKFPKDGGQINIVVTPGVNIEGVLMKQRSFNLHGVLIVEDEKGGFYSEVVYNPDKKSGLGSMISKQKTPMDYMEGVITNHRCNYEKERGSKKVKSYNLLGKITGRWTQEMKIDDKLYWKRDE